MKHKNLFILLFLSLFSLILSVDNYAQTKARKGTSAKTQATKKAEPNAKTTAVQSGTLTLEAGLVLNSGDVKPVARAEFYLLDQDLETILSSANVKKNEQDSWNKHYAFMKRSAQEYGDTYLMLEGENLKKADAAIKLHTIVTTTTDFSGKGEFSEVKTGKYYLVGTASANSQLVLWVTPLEIKAGKQSVILDQKNAAVIR